MRCNGTCPFRNSSQRLLPFVQFPILWFQSIEDGSPEIHGVNVSDYAEIVDKKFTNDNGCTGNKNRLRLSGQAQVSKRLDIYRHHMPHSKML